MARHIARLDAPFLGRGSSVLLNRDPGYHGGHSANELPERVPVKNSSILLNHLLYSIYSKPEGCIGLRDPDCGKVGRPIPYQPRKARTPVILHFKPCPVTDISRSGCGQVALFNPHQSQPTSNGSQKYECAPYHHRSRYPHVHISGCLRG